VVKGTPAWRAPHFAAARAHDDYVLLPRADRAMGRIVEQEPRAYRVPEAFRAWISARRQVRGRSLPHKEPAPEAACEHQARPITERGAQGNNVDAQALFAGEQTVTGAVSPAMLAVTSLRHLTPGKERGPSRPLMPS